MPDGTSSTLNEVKISELPVATGVNDTDQLEANQAGTTRSITVGQVKAAAVAAVPTPPAVTDTSPRSFGAVGDGITDDTAALQAAINACATAGGGIVNCTGGRWLIDSANLIVKNGVFLVGSWLNLGQPQALVSFSFDYSTTKSAFIVNPARTIQLAERDCGIQGMAILRKGLTTPTTIRQSVDLVAAFAGTAVTVGDGVGHTAQDCWLSQLFIAGFATAITSNFSDRLRIEWISGDNLAGIYMTQSYDMQHCSHVHFWPFTTAALTPVAYAVSGAVSNGGLVRLTIASSVLVTGDRVTVTVVGGVTGATGPFIATVINPTTIDLQGSTFGGAYTSGGSVILSAWYRSGVGINFDTATDFGQLDTCFTYNYATGIKINSSDQVTLINCGTDSYPVAGDTSTTGIWVTGTAAAAALVGCKTSAQGVGLKIDTSATSRDTVEVTGHRAWGNFTYAYQVADGWASFVNCEAKINQVIRVDDLASGVSFAGGDLTTVTFSYQSAASPRPTLISTRGALAPVNPVVNAVNGSTNLARFEAHNSTPAANDTIYKSYALTNSSGAQVEVIRESYRATAVTAGAMTGQIFWAISNAGTFANVAQMTPNVLAPITNDGMALGVSTASWADLFLASGGVLNWNNGTYTLTQSSTTLTASGALTVGANLVVGTDGATNGVTIRGTSATTALQINATGGTKFLSIQPEFATDTGRLFYWNGAAVANFELHGTIKFPTVSPIALSGTAVAAGSATQAFIKASSTANLGIYYGTGVPSFSAAKGSLYSCTNATTTTTRLYVNTDGAATWATITTSA